MTVSQNRRAKGKGKTIVGEASKPKTGGCFICNEPHRACEYPRQESLNALIANGKQGSSDDPEEEQVLVSPLQVLVGAIQASILVGGLIWVQVLMNGEDYCVLVDIRASHNFVAGRMVVALGL